MAARYEGFAEFVAARGASLGRTAYVLTGDSHLAEDLVQTALAKAAQRWARLDEPEAYVRRVMFNEHISWWRRRKFVREVSLDARVEDSRSAREPSDESTTRRMAVQQALRLLTPKQRTVLVLRFYEDLTEAQAAEVLGVSVGTIKSQSHVALRRLRTLAPHLADMAFQTIEERS